MQQVPRKVRVPNNLVLLSEEELELPDQVFTPVTHSIQVLRERLASNVVSVATEVRLVASQATVDRLAVMKKAAQRLKK